MIRWLRLVLMIEVMAMLIGCDLGCSRAPGRPSVDGEPEPPGKRLDFVSLYSANCAGCHGPEGRGGAAAPLANPVYLAVADDRVLRRITAEGVPGTLMPAFAREDGGMLTDEQIEAIVSGMRTRWARPQATAGQAVPPYADAAPGDAQRGSAAFSTYCARCHGKSGEGATPTPSRKERASPTPSRTPAAASSIVDRAFLALVSDQGLRTTIIAGRPDLNAPDWRGNVPGRPMSPQEISDIVAWLSAQRTEIEDHP
jgi:cytochrome c oxidase cbb3-type subunit III